LLRLSIHAWGIHRKLRPDQYHVDAEKSMTRAGKKLLKSPELDAIYALDKRVTEWVRSRSVPSSYKRGTYLQPVANLLEVDNELLAYRQRRGQFLELFLDAYPGRVREAFKDLGPLFDAGNYLHPEEMRKRFSVEWDYAEITTAPGALSNLKPELFRREAEKAQLKWATALDRAQALLRMEFAECVRHLEDRLRDGEIGPDGQVRPRRFGPQMIEGVQDWISTWRARNIADDSELDALVRQADALLDGMQTAHLADDEGLRQELHRSFAAIAGAAEPLLTGHASRWIELPEDDE